MTITAEVGVPTASTFERRGVVFDQPQTKLVQIPTKIL